MHGTLGRSSWSYPTPAWLFAIVSSALAVSVPAQATWGPGAIVPGTPWFAPRTRVSNVSGPRYLPSVSLPCDVDLDGDFDLVLGVNGAQSQLWINDGRGSFTDETASRLPAGVHPTDDGMAGDLDGDGDPDLVFLNNVRLGPVTYSVVVLANDGSGRFTDVTATALPASAQVTAPTKGVLGDLDGDGDLDIVATEMLAAPQFHLYFNDGKGVFADGTAGNVPPHLPFATQYPAMADFDGDGDLDLFTGDVFFTSRLYLNNGRGAFSDVSATHLWPRSGLSEIPAAGDVDGDGDVDIVVNTAAPLPQYALYRNDGTGRFTRAPFGQRVDYGLSADLVDVDLDGDLDAVFGNWTATLFLQDAPSQDDVYTNDGNGVFATSTTAFFAREQTRLLDMGVGDLDGDGDPDLVAGVLCCPLTGTVRVLYNHHRHLVAPAAPQAGQPFVLDVYGQQGQTAVCLLSPRPGRVPLGTLGVLGLDAQGLVAWPVAVSLQPRFPGRVTLPVPPGGALLGQSFAAQAVILDAQRPGQSHLTNTVVETVR